MTSNAPLPQPTQILEEVAAAAQESVEEIVKVGQEEVRKRYDETVTVAREHMDKAQAQLTQGYEEFTAFSQGNVEAVIAASTLSYKGAERIGKAVVAYAQASLDKSIALGRAVLGARSVTEVVAISNDFAKSSYETAVVEATRIQELGVEVANEALAPLSARFNVAVEKFAKPLAA